jgi:predicted Zn-ribbon and HTH transcriptional regulator
MTEAPDVETLIAEEEIKHAVRCPSCNSTDRHGIARRMKDRAGMRIYGCDCRKCGQQWKSIWPQ